MFILILGELLPLGISEIYPCRKCNRIYARKYTRSRHERLECGIAAQFECPFCNFRAKHKHNLKSHISKAHQWNCDRWGAKFTDFFQVKFLRNKISWFFWTFTKFHDFLNFHKISWFLWTFKNKTVHFLNSWSILLIFYPFFYYSINWMANVIPQWTKTKTQISNYLTTRKFALSKPPTYFKFTYFWLKLDIFHNF